jgi:hypothetical protein
MVTIRPGFSGTVPEMTRAGRTFPFFIFPIFCLPDNILQKKRDFPGQETATALCMGQ